MFYFITDYIIYLFIMLFSHWLCYLAIDYYLTSAVSPKVHIANIFGQLNLILIGQDEYLSHLCVHCRLATTIDVGTNLQSVKNTGWLSHHDSLTRCGNRKPLLAEGEPSTNRKFASRMNSLSTDTVTVFTVGKWSWFAEMNRCRKYYCFASGWISLYMN